MKKIYSFILGLFLISTLALAGAGCGTTPASTPIQATPTVIPYKDLVENFIKNSATYAFDGIEGSLNLVNTIGSTEGNQPTPIQEWEFTIKYQTRHPGHGDRKGQVLAQVITNHTAIVKVKGGQIVSAICDQVWDMIQEKSSPTSVTGTVISGGDTTTSDGPTDAPRKFTYQVKKADGNLINVAYTAYPPSPMGEVARAKITLDFSSGSISIGDTIEARGTLDKETNTLSVADQGDYIRTYPAQP
jgi:hypothetical protein